jgi:hypothetical protein
VAQVALDADGGYLQARDRIAELQETLDRLLR